MIQTLRERYSDCFDPSGPKSPMIVIHCPMCGWQQEVEEERAKVSRVKGSFDTVATGYEQTVQQLKAENGALRAAPKAVL